MKMKRRLRQNVSTLQNLIKNVYFAVTDEKVGFMQPGEVSYEIWKKYSNKMKQILRDMQKQFSQGISKQEMKYYIFSKNLPRHIQKSKLLSLKKLRNLISIIKKEYHEKFWDKIDW